MRLVSSLVTLSLTLRLLGCSEDATTPSLRPNPTSGVNARPNNGPGVLSGASSPAAAETAVTGPTKPSSATVVAVASVPGPTKPSSAMVVAVAPVSGPSKLPAGRVLAVASVPGPTTISTAKALPSGRPATRSSSSSPVTVASPFVAAALPRTAGAKGIPNRGATCYFNSVWQTLSHAVRFRAVVSALGQPTRTTTVPARLIIESKRLLQQQWSAADTGALDAGPLLAVLREDDPNGQFRAHQMQDASEAMTVFIDRLTDAVDLSLGGVPPITMFTFGFDEVLACADTSYPERRPSVRTMLQLAVLQQDEPVTLRSLIDAALAPEELTLPRCVVWGGLGMKSKEIVTTPEVLLISLGRGDRTDTDPGQVVNTGVNFPLEMNFGLTNDPFRLVGVVHRTGTSRAGGHYISDFLHPTLGQWVTADDAAVYTIAPPGRASRTASILVYEKISPAAAGLAAL